MCVEPLLLLYTLVIYIFVLVYYLTIWCGVGWRAAGILLPYFLRIVKGDKNGRYEESGKPLLYIISYGKGRRRRGRECMVSPNPKCLVLAILLIGLQARYIQVDISITFNFVLRLL